MEVSKEKNIDSVYEMQFSTQKLLNFYTSIVDRITKGEKFSVILEIINRKLEELFNHQMFCSIFDLGKQKELHINEASYLPNGLKKELNVLLTKKLEKGLFLKAGRLSETLISLNDDANPIDNEICDLLLHFGIQDCSSTEISLDGKSIGILVVFHTKKCRRTEIENQILKTIANLVALAIDRDKRKKLELELSDTYQEMEQLFKNHEGMIFKYQKQNRRFIHTFGDGQLIGKLGLQKEKCVGKSLYDFLPAEIAARKTVYYEQAWNGVETTYEGEVNGIHYVASLKPVFKGEKVVEVIVSCNEITELKKAHEELRSNKELLESFIQNTVDAIATKDTNDNITFVNQAYLDMFGWEKDEIIGKKTEAVPENYKEEYFKYTNMVLAGKKVEIQETRRRKKDGTSIPVCITKSPIKDKNGKVIGVASIIRDITEQKRIEQELEENKQRYQSLFYANPNLVYSLDLNGIFINVNPLIEEIIGYTPEEMIGKSYEPFTEGKSLSRTKRYFEKASQGSPQSYETIAIHKNGQRVILKVTNIPIIVNGNIVGVFGITKDITERKRTEEYIRKMERLTAIGKLAAGIAHEIRNPLTSVKGFLQLMREQSEDKSYFEIMLLEIDRIELITNEFLILSKPQVRNYNYKSIETILNHFLPLIETQALLNNIEIITDVEDQLPNIYCDVNQIKQVFLNIIKNSIESMSQGGQINISVKKSPKYIVIMVEDEGCGIEPDRLKTIGEPFYSTKEKGTGLGLMVSFNIIKEHHGDIQIKSELNKGTQVKIYLPYTDQFNEDFG